MHASKAEAPKRVSAAFIFVHEELWNRLSANPDGPLQSRSAGASAHPRPTQATSSSGEKRWTTSVRLAMWELNQNDRKRDTGAKLCRSRARERERERASRALESNLPTSKSSLRLCVDSPVQIALDRSTEMCDAGSGSRNRCA